MSSATLAINEAPLIAPERASNVRWSVFALLCAVMFILYLDRTCMGKAAPQIQADLKLSDWQMGFIHASFTIAYGLFEVVSGGFGDRYGSRKVLARIVLWWSLFTSLTGAANGFFMLIGIRFLFGVGEAGALPNVARIIDSWFPLASRGRIRGLVHMPALLGATLAPILTAYLMELIGWRWVFGVYGIVGAVWAGAFLLLYRDQPGDHAGVNAAELALIGPPVSATHTPWSDLAIALRHRNVWLMGTVMICGASTMSLIFSWYPTYLEKVHHVPNVQSGWFNSGIMAGGAIGCLLGGWLADLALRHFRSRRLARSFVGSGGFGIAALAMFASLFCSDVILKTACLTVTCLGIHTHVGPWWGANSDISGRNVAAMFGLMNSMGVLGATLSQAGFGFLPRESWGAGFGLCSGLLLIGSICWANVDCSRQVFKSDKPGH